MRKRRGRCSFCFSSPEESDSGQLQLCSSIDFIFRCSICTEWTLFRELRDDRRMNELLFARLALRVEADITNGLPTGSDNGSARSRNVSLLLLQGIGDTLVQGCRETQWYLTVIFIGDTLTWTKKLLNTYCKIELQKNMLWCRYREFKNVNQQRPLRGEIGRIVCFITVSWAKRTCLKAVLVFWSPELPSGPHSYRLEELAYTRSGDKGDSANIGEKRLKAKWTNTEVLLTSEHRHRSLLNVKLK